MSFIEDCNKCKGDLKCHLGLEGINSKNTGVMIVLNQPDSRILVPVLFGDSYEIALMETHTGEQLNKMLEYEGLLEYNKLSLEDVYLTNIFKGVLPKLDFQRGDEYSKYPLSNQYKTCIENQLEKQIEEFSPRGIVACGGQVLNAMFRKEGKRLKINDFEKKILEYNEIPTMILPHPSRIWAIKNLEKQKNYYSTFKSFLQTIKS